MSDEPRDPALEVVLKSVHDAVLESMFGAMPGVVVSYDSATRTASVQPCLNRSYFDETDTRQQPMLPILHDVPVMLMGNSVALIKLPLAKGDGVLLVWCGQSLYTWKKRGGVVSDPDDRRFDFNDCVCYPGCFDSTHAADPALVLEFTGTTINIGGSDQLVTKTDFLNHTHLTAGTGSPVGPTTIAGTFNYTDKLRG